MTKSKIVVKLLETSPPDISILHVPPRPRPNPYSIGVRAEVLYDAFEGASIGGGGGRISTTTRQVTNIRVRLGTGRERGPDTEQEVPAGNEAPRGETGWKRIEFKADPIELGVHNGLHELGDIPLVISFELKTLMVVDGKAQPPVVTRHSWTKVVKVVLNTAD